MSNDPDDPTRLRTLTAPTLAQMEAIADEAFAALPAAFKVLCEGLVIRVEDFPDEETLDDMEAESEFELLGLFRGRGLAHRGAVLETGELPNWSGSTAAPSSTTGPSMRRRWAM